jgi:hypothetical protein
MELMMKKRDDSHLPRSMFVEEIVRPVKNIMKEALLQTCPVLKVESADPFIYSIVGQLVHMIQAQELLSEMEKAIEH